MSNFCIVLLIVESVKLVLLVFAILVKFVVSTVAFAAQSNFAGIHVLVVPI
jgi:hypothetical protein